jgi:hypothetical protein
MSLLTLLREKIAKSIKTELKPAMQRVQAASDANQVELTNVQGQLAEVRSKIVAFESATPAELIRRGITAEKAVAQSDELARSAIPLEERERVLLGEIQLARSRCQADVSLICSLVKPLTDATEMLLRAQIAAELSSMIEPSRIDVLHELEAGRFGEMFRSTIAAEVIERRRSAIRAATEEDQFLAVAFEILEEPIPELARNPVEVPDNRNSMLVKSIRHLLERPFADVVGIGN